MSDIIKSNKQLLKLFWSFLKIGPVTFGGGYAMLPAMEREIVFHRKWLTEGEMAEVISLSGASPGGIGVNAAAFIGYKVMGWRGLTAAVAGILLPTFLIVLGLGILFREMGDHPKFIAFMKGIQIAVIALIAYAGFKMAKTAVIDKTTAFMFAAGLFVLLFLHFHPVILIPIGVAAGIIVVMLNDKFGLHLLKSSEAKGKQTDTMLLHKYDENYFGDGI